MQQPHEPEDLPVLFLVPVFAQTLFAFVGGDFMSFTFFSAGHTGEFELR